MKKLILLVVTGLFLITATACGSTDSDNDSDGDNEEETVTIEHELGTAEVTKSPEKVVVFDYGTLDTLDALDIDVTAVSKMNVPSYLDQYDTDEYENAGTLFEPDFEKLSEIDPDLILISGRQSEVYDQLEELAPTVYLDVDTTRYMDSFKENAKTIGEIFDKQDEVEQALHDIDDKVVNVKEKAEKSGKNGLIILANDDKISAYGPGSRFGLIHDALGIPAVDEDIEASTHGMNVTFEYVAEKDPDLLYVIDRSNAIGEEPAAKNVIENKLMEKTKAMKKDNIVFLDPEVWYLSGGGLVSVQEMIQEVSDSLD